jgi:hypothetical protein
MKLQDFSFDITAILAIEKQAEALNNHGQHKEASELIQNLIYANSLPQSEHGWYLQMIARFTYQEDKTESNQLQINAFRKNKQLLKPRDGYLYKKIKLIQSNRLSNLKTWILKLGSQEQLTEKINEICSLLSFEETADNFEAGIQELGSALGFESQRPDKEDREGPDNLWALSENDFFLIECKNEVDAKREEISKNETGQMNTHCGWFKNNYPAANFKPVMVIHTKNVSAVGAFNFEVEILRKNGLKKLRDNFKNFYEELKNYDMSDLTDDQLQKMLAMNKLDNTSVKNNYTEKPYQR